MNEQNQPQVPAVPDNESYASHVDDAHGQNSPEVTVDAPQDTVVVTGEPQVVTEEDLAQPEDDGVDDETELDDESEPDFDVDETDEEDQA